jgi:hypothetical protein
MPPISKRCEFCSFCKKSFPTQRGVRQHISASKKCLNEWHQEMVRKKETRSPKRMRTNSPDPSLLDCDYPDPTSNFDDRLDGRLGAHLEDDSNEHSQLGAHLEDADDNNERDDHLATLRRYVEPFPGPAGGVLRQEKTRFEILKENQLLDGKPPWEPFASREEWGLVQWLMTNVGQGSTDEYLKLPIVSGYLCSI